MSIMTYDIAIIGGGPAGYNAASRAAESGMSTVLFERDAIGGVCLNEGCIPTKTLLYSAKVLDGARSASKYGIVLGSDFGFDLDKIFDRKNKVVKKLTAGVRMKLEGNGVTLVSGTAQLTGEENHAIQIACGSEVYRAAYVLLCTGSDTVIPTIKGLNESGYWTSREALESKELPRSLVVIGGGVIGMEFASFYNSMGVKVTVVEAMPEVLGAMDKEISKMLRSEYSKKGIAFHLDSKVTEVSSTQVVFEKNGKTETLPAEKVLVSVGRKPIVEGLGLEKLNIAFTQKGIQVNEFMQTSHPKVYASGDITGFSMLAHTAIREGEVAIENIIGKQESMSYRAIPGVVYTNPEVAGVGATEEELLAKGLSYRSLKLPMGYSGRFVAENELGSGICKLLTSLEGQILGCHMLGNPASELIVLAGLAIEQNLTIEAFKKLVFPHPTVSEIIHESLYV
jgi:dihydrolipoamide dehydrogenase